MILEVADQALQCAYATRHNKHSELQLVITSAAAKRLRQAWESCSETAWTATLAICRQPRTRTVKDVKRGTP